jgi:FMN phosphatase YigB (HAD superfamily)
MSPIRAVWFDVGEVLINETREYGTWADWLGIPRHTFSAVFGAVIARGEDYRKVFRYFRPDFDLDAARQSRPRRVPQRQRPLPRGAPLLHALKDAGYFVGIAGNQTTRAGHFLRELNLPCDILATSDDWGVTKPDVAFFSKLIAVSGHQPHEIAYVGDRLDNDLRPATEAGLRTVFVRRGPWGYIIYKPGTADLELDSLSELPAALKTLSAD